MTDKLISIVIPVYNVEKFIRDCLDSVICQTYKVIEILLIDDGSTDRSGEICDEYEKKDQRITVLHQENQGLSSARNLGIQTAKGSLITFLDSDDMIAPRYLETLYDAMIETEADIAVSDYGRISSEGNSIKEIEECSTKCSNVVFNNVDAIKEVYGKKYHGMQFIACGKLYRKSLYKDKGIVFPIGKIHEDTFTTYKVIYAARRICYVDTPLYLYRVRSGSIMNSHFSEKSLVKFDAIKEECDFYKNNNQIELLNLAFFNYLHEKKNTINEMLTDKTIERSRVKELSKTIIGDINVYSKYIKIPLKKRISYIILAYFPRVVKFR